MDGGLREFEYELQSDVPESGLRWDGDTLVVTFTNRLPEGEMTISFRYELIDDGHRLRASEQVRGVPWAQDNVWIFESENHAYATTPTSAGSPLRRGSGFSDTRDRL